jgi:valyl-tRNA synthetase
MELIGKNGSDVLRFTLTSLTTPGRNLILGDEKIEGVRNFTNKLWNASKFVISNLGEMENNDSIKIEQLDLNIWDRWILSGLNRTIRDVEKYLGKYNFSFASRLLTDFFWNEYCDWYIESAKIRVYSAKNDNDKRSVIFMLWYVLESYLKLLHPFMPFITEMIWQNIPHCGDSIMVADFPEFDPEKVNKDAESRIRILFDVISEIRKIRSELKINPADRVRISLAVTKDRSKDILEKNKEYVCSLAKVSKMEFKDCTGEKGYIKTAINDIDIYIYILDVVDIKLESTRIKNQIVKINKAIEKSKKKVSSPDFIKKAPAEIIQKEKDRLDHAEKILKVLKDQLSRIKGIS